MLDLQPPSNCLCACRIVKLVPENGTGPTEGRCVRGHRVVLAENGWVLQGRRR